MSHHCEFGRRDHLGRAFHARERHLAGSHPSAAAVRQDVEQTSCLRRILVALLQEIGPLDHQPVARPGQGDIQQVAGIGLEIRPAILDEARLQDYLLAWLKVDQVGGEICRFDTAAAG